MTRSAPPAPARTGRVPSAPVVRSVDDVAANVHAAVRYGPPRAVGAELEWLAVDRAAPERRPDLERVDAALRTAEPLPGGSLLTREPGGQVELSSLPADGVAAAVDALAADVAAVRATLSAAGVELTGLGVDPLRPPVRQLNTSRYAVMDAYFTADGGASGLAGRTMMCCSAAVQVSLDAGTRGTGVQSAGERWARAHALGPALVAAFASSPVLEGRLTGWRSTRQRLWAELDPTRSRPPAPELDPVDALTDLAVSARLLALRGADGVCRPAPRGMTFGDWMRDASPTTDDLAYHLTTLFPPVRLRGWYELRYLDALPDPLWQVAVATAAALLDDDTAADAAREACAPVEGRWLDAARLATSDAELARAATGCLTAAAEALPRMGAPALAAAVTSYAERFAARGRCPADDVLDAVAGGRSPSELLLGRLAATA